MRDLNRIVVPRIQACWRDVAYALHYKVSTLDSIEAKHNKDPKKCCQGLFEDWLRTDHGEKAGPRTWSTLVRVLAEVEELTVAREEIAMDINVTVTSL